MAGVEGEEWVDLFLHVSTRDGSAARPLRLIPSWESAPRPRPEGALELVASGDDAASVSASEGSGLCVGQTLEEVNNLTLNIDKCGESICSVPLVRCNSQLECENLGSIQGRTYINLEVYPGDGRSIIRLYELGAGTKVCWKSSAVFFIHPMCLADSETNATPENDLANANSPEHLSEKNPIHFHGKECGDMCFPPLRMNFMKDFTRNKMIGQGNEGKVYMCLSKFRPHCSAIKKTEQSSLFARSNHQEPREVSILARLRHGHIIDLYQAWSEEQRSKRFMCVGPCVFVSLKLCHRSLTKYLDQRPELNSESNSCVFKQILRGLAYMHSMGVAHRDIKPDNILIEPDLSIKIADFGIAKVTQLPMNHDSDCEGFGSFPYCAPEMSDPSIRHDEKVDIFSAGMIYCELFLLCGVERRRDTLKELRKKVTTHGQKLERDLLGESFDLDDALKGSCLLENWTGDWAILKRMLSPKASDRFSASELLKMFDDRFPDDKNVSVGV